MKGKKTTPPLRSVLFVCTANVTRSPVAARMFQDLAEKSGEKWKVGSAGIRAGRGYPPNPVVSFLMFQRKLALTDHESRPLDKKLLHQYYWILTAEEAQRQEIVALDPSLESRTFTIRGLGRTPLPEQVDLPDPTGKDPDDYRELFSILEEEIPRIWEVLRIKVSDLEFQPSEE